VTGHFSSIAGRVAGTLALIRNNFKTPPGNAKQFLPPDGWKYGRDWSNRGKRVQISSRPASFAKK